MKSTLQSDKHLAEEPASYDCFLVNYLNIIQSSNERSLMQYWNSCFTRFSKFSYVQ